MSKSPLDMLDMCMLGPMILVCWIYFGVTGWLALINVTLTEYHILWGTFVSFFFYEYDIHNKKMKNIKKNKLHTR